MINASNFFLILLGLSVAIVLIARRIENYYEPKLTRLEKDVQRLKNRLIELEDQDDSDPLKTD